MNGYREFLINFIGKTGELQRHEPGWMFEIKKSAPDPHWSAKLADVGTDYAEFSSTAKPSRWSGLIIVPLNALTFNVE